MLNNEEIWDIATKEYQIQQKKPEFLDFLDLIRKENIKKILEIGCHSGGTTFGFLQLCDKLISIDGFRHDNIKRLEDLYPDNFLFIKGNSHETTTLELIKGLMIKEEFDMLFVDGDHSTEGSMQDFVMYSPLVKQGGLVVFHDVIDSNSHRIQGCHVYKTWGELKTRYSGKEFVHLMEADRSQEWAGLGYFYKD